MKENSYIDGQWATSSSKQWIEVINPSTQKKLGQVPSHSKEESLAAIEKSEIAFQSWRNTSPAERYEYLNKMKEYLIQNKNELGRILSLENGKSIKEAVGEVVYSAQYFEIYSEQAKRIEGSILASAKHQSLQVLKEAVGVCAAITPWNFPMAMLARKVAPALAAGCTMLAKPDHHTPFSALALAEAAEYAKLPKSVLNIITGMPDAVGAAFLESKKLKKLSFTGSTKVGQYLMRESAAHLKKLSLELGGNAPFIVFEDADIELAIEGALASKYRNSGQTCVCTNRFFIHESIFDSFIEKFRQRVSKLKIGDGLDTNTDIGPLIHQQAKQKVLNLVADAESHQAEKIVIGSPVDSNSCFLNPIFLKHKNYQAKMFQEEIFGPVSAFYPFQNEEQVIALANDTDYGLAAYFFTQNISRIHRVAKALEYGMIGINSGRVSNAYAPFGGMKFSGFGREGGQIGIEDYLITKLWHQELQ